jgi:hypothetical protein
VWRLFLINLSIIGVVSWREFVPADGNEKANFIVSVFMERVYGSKVVLFTRWCSIAFDPCLPSAGYSRIPYAAAQTPLPRFRPRCTRARISARLAGGDWWHRHSLQLSLLTVIDALLTTRILVQFIGRFCPHPANTRPPRGPTACGSILPILIALAG